MNAKHLVAAAAALVLASTAVHELWAAKGSFGVVLLEGSEEVAADRYRVPRDKDWDKTIRHFRTVYGKTQGIIFRNIASTPDVKAIHVENTRQDRSWEGINIYETNGEIFVYVIKAEKEPEKQSTKPQKASKRGK